jgi:hypothetical protein
MVRLAEIVEMTVHYLKKRRFIESARFVSLGHTGVQCTKRAKHQTALFQGVAHLATEKSAVFLCGADHFTAGAVLARHCFFHSITLGSSVYKRKV